MGYLHRFFSAPHRRLRAQQAGVAAGLSILFVAVYSTCNAITSIRPDVDTLYLSWEHHIPFVPILIIPYMSIDLFFVGAPFLCPTLAELKQFAKRITLAIVIAGGFFLLLPLTLVGDRPTTTGLLQPVFTFLHGFDQPHNLFPSLHIILRCILVHQYAIRTRGILRILVHLWFFLIGLSTLLVGQHHLADIVGGFLVAAFVFFAIRNDRQPSTLLPNNRVGGYYLVGGLTFILAAIYFWPWGVFLFWPAATLLTIAAGYYSIGSSLTAKRNGLIPLSTRIALAPWFFGQWLSLLYYKRQCAPWDELDAHVWIGRVLSDTEATHAVEAGVTATIDMTCEFKEAKPFRKMPYLNLQTLDLTAPSLNHLHQATDFIETHTQHGVVYLHCKIGYSRTAAVAGAYLLKTGKAHAVTEAIEMIKTVRPSAVVRPEIKILLQAYHQYLGQKND